MKIIPIFFSKKIYSVRSANDFFFLVWLVNVNHGMKRVGNHCLSTVPGMTNTSWTVSSSRMCQDPVFLILSVKWYLRIFRGRLRSLPGYLSKYWEMVCADSHLQEKWLSSGYSLKVEELTGLAGGCERVHAEKLYLLGEMVHEKIMSQRWLRLLWRVDVITYIWSSSLA